MMSSAKPNFIVLFDGFCNFCDAAVRRIIRIDKRRRIRFATLQSEAGRRVLRDHNIPLQNLETFVFISGDRCYLKSAGALRLVLALGGFWALGAVFLLIPRFLRDPVYDFIARNRYRWSGKKEVCITPSEEIRDRFLS